MNKWTNEPCFGGMIDKSKPASSEMFLMLVERPIPPPIKVAMFEGMRFVTAFIVSHKIPSILYNVLAGKQLKIYIAPLSG